ncbi:MAG: hypothetical protein Q9170_002349 [Blastenia crenularia]
MGKKLKQRKELDGKTNRAQEDISAEGAAFLEEPNHELDPDGDLVLILDSSSVGYKDAVNDARTGSQPDYADESMNTQSWDVSEVPTAGDDPSLEAVEEPTVDAPPMDETAVDEFIVEESAIEEPAAESVIEGAAAGKAAEISFAKSDDSILGDHKIALTSDRKDLCQAVRIRVSSKHLTLASSVFRTMFKAKYKEGLNLYSQGHAELLLPDDNPAAFLVIMHLIHGQISKVPRQINLWMLIELAILVDKYELLESVELLLDRWLQNLKSTIPQTLNNNLLPWICISWVFKKSEIFKKVTGIAQAESKGLLEANHLPIPESILNTIDQDRQNTLTEIFTYLQAVLERYKGSERNCPQGIECDGMILGSLTIGLNAINILQPPHPPYNGFSVKNISQRLREMRVPQYCQHLPNYGRHSWSSSGRTCEGIERPLKAQVEGLERQLRGLELFA